MSDYTPHPDDVTAGAEAWRVLLSSYGPHDFPRTEETVRVILAAVGPAIQDRALRQAADDWAVLIVQGKPMMTGAAWLRARADAEVSS